MLSQLAQNEEVLSTGLLINGTNVLICPETIATALTICYRLWETVSNYFAFLKSEKPSAILLASRQAKKSSRSVASVTPKAIKEATRMPSDVGVTITNVRVCFFERMDDDSWFCLSTEKMSFAVKLNGSQDEEKNALVVCELRLSVQSLLLSQDSPSKKLSAGQHWSLKTRKQNSQQRSVIEMPMGNIVLRNEQALATLSVVDFWFDSTFPKPVNVSLDIRHYNSIKNLAELFYRRVIDEWERLLPFAELLKQSPVPKKKPPTSPPLSVSSPPPSSSSSVSGKSAALSGSSDSSSKRRLPGSEVIFVQHSFVLEPSLSVLSDLTPSVSTVLGWLGISSPSTTIPRVLFLFVCRPLQMPLHLLVNTWYWIHESQEDSKSSNNSSSNGGNAIMAQSESKPSDVLRIEK